MGKLKTKSGAAKRFKISAGGKVMKKRSGARHNMGCKSHRRKRNMRKQSVLNSTQAKVIKRFLTGC